ncbi:hypothetical protein MO206_002813 [Listeria monocytogenes]|nr:hypothetical protein [Listeria monocytogenes]EIZ2731115.1 hypothetical protein [Listeria monocytogenes]EIZ2734033.1 hypothetical protein [Listeria monocytogenes]EIZ2736885.1 hypothetical protein [Listeria monocytogenes]EIZ2828188.1 hypothetical protein [Listeria monocytogenes]
MNKNHKKNSILNSLKGLTTTFSSKHKSEQVPLYYVTLLNCDECVFQTEVFTSYKKAKACFYVKKQDILSKTTIENIYEQEQYFINTFSFVLKLGKN